MIDAVIRPFYRTTPDYERYVALLNSIDSDQPASVAYEQRQDREWPAEQLRERLLILDLDGTALAAADYHHMPWSYHPRKFGLNILVRADARRQGLGSRLFKYIVDSVAVYDPLSLEAPTREDWSDGVHFLEKRGFRVVHRQQQSELDPAGFDSAPFAQTMAAVAESGLVVRTLAEGLAADPDLLRKIYNLVSEVMPDLPWYDGLTERPFAEWLQNNYEDNPDLLTDGYFIAFDGDQVAGISQLWGSEATDSVLYTGFTAVRRPYRHRGLATAMKVRALQYAQSRTASDGKPPRIVTSNEQSNPMLQINLRLGFQERPTRLIYVREEKQHHP